MCMHAWMCIWRVHSYPLPMVKIALVLFFLQFSKGSLYIRKVILSLSYWLKIFFLNMSCLQIWLSFLLFCLTVKNSTFLHSEICQSFFSGFYALLGNTFPNMKINFQKSSIFFSIPLRFLCLISKYFTLLEFAWYNQL